METRVARVTRGAVYISFQTAAVYAIGLIFYMIVARLLPRSDIGSLSILNFVYYTFLLLAGTYTSLSLASAAVKYISEYMGQNNPKKASSVVLTTKRMIFTLSIASLVVSLLLSNRFSLFIWKNTAGTLILLITFVAAFFGVMRTTYLAFLQGLQKFDKYAIVAFSAFSVGRALGVILVFLGYGLTGIVLGWAIGDVTGFFLSIFFFRGILPKAETPHDIKPLISFGMPVFFFASISLFLDWIDRVLFLALTSDLSELGVYDLAIRGSMTLSIIWMTVSITVFPALSELHGQAGKVGFTKAIKLSTRYLAYLILPAALGLAAMSRTAMALMFGWEVETGNLSLSILAVGTIFWSFSMLFTSTLQAIGETKVFIKIALIAMLADIVTVLLLTPILSIIGATVGRIIMVAVCFAYSLHALNRHVRVKFDREALLKASIAAGIMIIPVVFFEWFYSGKLLAFYAFSVFPEIMRGVVVALVEIMIGVCTYGVMLYLLHALNLEDFNLLKRVLPKPLHGILNMLEQIYLR